MSAVAIMSQAPARKFRRLRVRATLGAIALDPLLILLDPDPDPDPNPDKRVILDLDPDRDDALDASSEKVPALDASSDEFAEEPTLDLMMALGRPQRPVSVPIEEADTLPATAIEVAMAIQDFLAQPFIHPIAPRRSCMTM